MASLVNNKIECFHGCTIKLGADIDLAGKEWTPIGNGSYKDFCFTGTFDGNGYTISNLTITNGTGGVGLFGTISLTSKNWGGTENNSNDKGRGEYPDNVSISNFKMENVKISGGSYTGAVVGAVHSVDGGDGSSKFSISKITVEGVDIESNLNVGGILGMCGSAGRFTIDACVVTGTDKMNTLTVNSDGKDNTHEFLGGIVGNFAYNTITNCTVSNINFKGTLFVGGISGYACNEYGKTIKHTGNTVEDISIISKGGNVDFNGDKEGEEYYTYYVGAILGLEVNPNLETYGNTFKNVTIQIEENNELRDVAVNDFGVVVPAPGGAFQMDVKDTSAPVAQIVDKDGNTYGSFTNLEDTVGHYAADGKTVDLLTDVTLENTLVVPEDVELNTGDKNLTGDVTSENGSVTLNGVTFTGTEGENLTLQVKNNVVQNLNGVTEVTVSENGGTILVGDMIYNAASGDTKITVDPETGNLNITPGVGDSMIVNGVETTPTQDVVINPEGDVNTQIYQDGKNIIFNMGQAVEGVKYSFQTKLTSKADRYWKDAGKITIDQNGDIIVTVKASAFRNNQEYDYRLVADDVAQYGDMLTVSTLARPSWKAQVVDTIHFNVTPKAIDANAQELKVTYRAKVNNKWSNWTETTLNALMDEGIVTFKDGVYTATAPDNMAGTQIQFKVYAEGGLKGQTLYLDSNSANGSISLKKPAKLSTPSIKVSFTKETISLKDVKNAALVDYQYEIKIGLSKSNMTTMVYASDSTLINAMRDGDFDTFVTELGIKDYAGERVYFSLTALSVNTVSYLNSSTTSTMWNLSKVTF